jgi:Dirigent-like protein
MSITSLPRSPRLPGRVVTAGLVAALAVTGTTAIAEAAAAPRTAAPSSHSRVLHYGIKFSPFNVIDVPPLQRSQGDYQAGDYTVFSDVLTNRAGTPVGTEGGTGVITMVSSSGAQIAYSLSIQLPAGQIAAMGLGSPDPHKHVAVVGGTGSYTGADGYLDVIENGDGTGSLTITLR